MAHRISARISIGKSRMCGPRRGTFNSGSKAAWVNKLASLQQLQTYHCQPFESDWPPLRLQVKVLPQMQDRPSSTFARTSIMGQNRAPDVDATCMGSRIGSLES